VFENDDFQAIYTQKYLANGKQYGLLLLTINRKSHTVD